MADVCDLADDVIENHLQKSLEAVRASAPKLALTGTCHNCGESVEPWEHFCDHDCRDDWDLRQDAMKRNGRV